MALLSCLLIPEGGAFSVWRLHGPKLAALPQHKLRFPPPSFSRFFPPVHSLHLVDWNVHAEIVTQSQIELGGRAACLRLCSKLLDVKTVVTRHFTSHNVNNPLWLIPATCT